MTATSVWDPGRAAAPRAASTGRSLIRLQIDPDHRVEDRTAVVAGRVRGRGKRFGWLEQHRGRDDRQHRRDVGKARDRLQRRVVDPPRCARSRIVAVERDRRRRGGVDLDAGERATFADLVEHPLLGRRYWRSATTRASAAPSATASTVSTARPPRRPTLRRASAIASRHVTRRRSDRRRDASGDRPRAATVSSCVTTTIVVPRSAGTRSSRSSTTDEDAASRLPVGSSARTSCGSFANARAIATRCFSPPLNACGRWPAGASKADRVEEHHEPALAAAAATRARRSMRAPRSRARSAGRADRNPGRRSRRPRVGSAPARRGPARRGHVRRPSPCRPGRSSPPSTESSVVLPEPEAPVTATVVPLATSKSR